ncbi:MAG: sensor histidine kinase [Gammaproteobacteria bacterium]|nr:MAG: sensor histidine kinase [Gammaproteobacteria bacterium]
MAGPPERDEARLKAQIAEGFRRLKFEPRLEAAYQQHYYESLRDRVPWVALSALLFFLIYALMDYAALSPGVYSLSIPVRLLVACPTVALTLYAHMRYWPRERFLPLYSATYLIGGLSVVAILWIAHSQKFDMPYEGLFIVVIFGFFLMGLSFRTGTLLSLMIVVAYMGMELGMGRRPEMLAYEGFFLVTGVAAGSVGAWLQEFAHRRAFLDACLLECARIRTERDSQAKTRFIAAAGHDLRQPLHSLALMASAMGEDLDSDERVMLARRMDAAVQHLNRLIGNLLDVSRLSLGASQPEWDNVRFADSLEHIRPELEALANAQGVDLQWQVPQDGVVRADAVWLERILVNLVVNACVHSGGTAVRVQALRRGPRWRFEVQDNGVGIDPVQQSQIFREFYRGDAVPRDSDSGMGLGLSIVRRMLMAMEAPMGVISAKGQGSTFWLELQAVSTPETTEKQDSLPIFV